MDAFDRRAWVGCVAAVAAALMLAAGAVSASAAGEPRAAHVPRRLRLAPGDAPRPRVRHARGPAPRRRATTRWRPRAAARRAAPSGPTCARAGYVWREAVPGDHVCVTPATWQQVHDDNLTAGARRNALRVKVGTTDDRHAALLGARRRHQRRDGPRRRCSGPAADEARACPGPCARAAAPTGPGGELFLRDQAARCAGAARTPIIRVRDPLVACAGPRRARSRRAARASSSRPTS